MNKRNYNFLIVGFFGAVLLAIGDWLIGFINPQQIRNSIILVEGCNQIGYDRPVLSMLVAIIGSMLCTISMYKLSQVILAEKLRKIYKISVILGSVHWLFIHFAFCGFRLIYQYLWDALYFDIAVNCVDYATKAFTPLFYLSCGFIFIPFIIYFIAIILKKTIIPKWTACFFMLTFSIIFKIIARCIGQSNLANGFSTASNNMGIALWFLCTWIYIKKKTITTPCFHS